MSSEQSTRCSFNSLTCSFNVLRVLSSITVCTLSALIASPALSKLIGSPFGSVNGFSYTNNSISRSSRYSSTSKSLYLSYRSAMSATFSASSGSSSELLLSVSVSSSSLSNISRAASISSWCSK